MFGYVLKKMYFCNYENDVGGFIVACVYARRVWQGT